MKHTSLSQAGFTHLILIAGTVLVLSVASFVGYRSYKDHYQAVSYVGTFQKQKCTTINPGCTGYALAATNTKSYNLNLSAATPPVASGTKVAVTGTAATSGSGASTIAVTKIVPMVTAAVKPGSQTPTPTPTTQTPTVAPTPNLDEQIINGTAYLSPNPGEGLSIQYDDVEGATTYHPFIPLQHSIDASTSITNKAGKAIRFTDIVIGDNLQVKEHKNPAVSAANGSTTTNPVKIYSIQDLSR